MTDAGQSEVWITAAQRGDRLALARLLARCHPKLQARAETRMDAALKVRGSPEDILQEVYLDVARQIDRFEHRGADSFLHWVQAILDQKLVDARRAAHCQARDVDREARVTGRKSDSYWNLLNELHAESGTPSGVIRGQEAVEALLACLSDLSETHRQVLQLRYLDGCSTSETAAQLGKSEAAVVALTRRALDALRRSMDQLGEFTHGA